MKWLITVWSFITSNRRDVQDALKEWRLLYEAQVARSVAAELRIDVLEHKQQENDAKLTACLEDCRKCHEARDRQQAEINELKRRMEAQG